MKYHLLKGDLKAMYKTPRTRLRTPIGLPKVLLVIGGQAPKAIRSVECYDFKEEKWTQLADMQSRRCRCGKKNLKSSLISLHKKARNRVVGLEVVTSHWAGHIWAYSSLHT